jgi:peptide/nickel transport system substrate-binding protein
MRLGRIALAAAIPFTIWGGAAPAKAETHDTLTIGLSTFPPSLHPLTGAELVRSYILAMVARPLMAFDPDWKLVCLLCTTVPTFENGLARAIDLGDGKKGVALTLAIQPGATWGDGTPVTTKDMVFTREVNRHPMSGVVSGEFDRRVLKIEVKDEKTFVLHIDRITFDYNNLAGYRVLPAHLEAKAFAKPEDYAKRSVYETNPTERGLYFGPYRIAEFVAGAHVVLVPNETWFGPKPFFQRIVLRVFENTAALEANLLAGGIDFIPGEGGLTLDQVLALEARHPQRFRYLYKTTTSYSHLDVNLEHPALKDKRVRQALLLASDRAAIARQIYGGKVAVADSSVNPLQWMAAADIRQYSFDPAAAKRLLDEAGWSDIRGGIRHNAAGERLSFGFAGVAGIKANELVMSVLAAQWRQVGIDARIRGQPARVFFGDTLQHRKFDGLAFFAWIVSPESVPRTIVHSAMIPAAGNGWQGQNFTGYRNPEMDSLIDGIERELDRDKRRALWHRYQELYAEDLPALPMFFGTVGFVMPLWLEGVRPTGQSATSSLWVEEWKSK